MLYPLKFKPRLKERIWGGRKLQEVLGKRLPEGREIGESWEISAVQGDVSVVAEGPLAGNTLQELIEIYMGELVGDKVYEKYGEEFPLLIKFIDARRNLSVQVHPDDELALVRHDSYGKTEMWYVVEADPGAVLYVGFNREVTPQEYMDAVADGTLPQLLRRFEVKAGDSFFIPAGTIHAIGAGVVIAEIQQTSDITYRVYDWGHTGQDGKPRELHTELAVGALDFGPPRDLENTVAPRANRVETVEQCDYFNVNLIKVEGNMERDYSATDSFTIYICLEGELAIRYSEGAVKMKKGETVLVPRQEDNIELDGEGLLLETYLETYMDYPANY